jgi:hypothetical protein
MLLLGGRFPIKTIMVLQLKETYNLINFILTESGRNMSLATYDGMVMITLLA